jgi:hypothetical protein
MAAVGSLPRVTTVPVVIAFPSLCSDAAIHTPWRKATAEQWGSVPAT